MKKIKYQILNFVWVLICITTFLIGMFYQDLVGEEKIEIETRQTGFNFISPLIDCHIDKIHTYNRFTRNLGNKLQKLIESKPGITTSVLFRDLKNGPSVTINPHAKFNPASLSKIPVMMAYFQYAEDRPEILNKELQYNSSPEDYQVHYPPKDMLVDKKVYTINELIYRMIAYSDNGARNLLVNDVVQNFNNKNKSPEYLSLSIDAYSDVFKVLMLSSPDEPNHLMNVSEIGSFFRILFNASYLGRTNSEKSLEILSQVTFNHGLTKYLDPKIKVAHKFGEGQNEYSRELHDCGIIYYPKYPYLLCVLTKGNKNNDQANLISKISKLVYEEVSEVEN